MGEVWKQSKPSGGRPVDVVSERADHRERDRERERDRIVCEGRRRSRGFTLIELIVVVAIIGILATLALPGLHHAQRKAREAVLKADLYQIRSAIDQHLGDKGTYPESLDAVVQAGYLRFKPVDPITKSADTWIEINATQTDIDELQPIDEDLGGTTGIIDVKSGADGVGLDGTLYSEW